jgi:DNA-binding PadR family transcriptional regulator
VSLKHALLGLLAEGPASGYELTKRFELSLSNVWSARHSQIYGELAKLTGLGFVRPGEEGARGRVDYHITSEGRAELIRWLVEDEPERKLRNEAMLRVFFLWTLDDDAAARYLEEEAGHYRAAARRFEDIDRLVAWDATGSDRMGRIALEQGRRWVAAMEAWATWAAGQIRAGHGAPDLEGMLTRAE